MRRAEIKIAYDMVATSLVNPADDEDMALTLNAKKKKLKRQDFVSAFTASGLSPKQLTEPASKPYITVYPVLHAED